MSITLLISGDNIVESEWKSFPVATESVFREVWLPISDKSGLKYVPLFQFGLDVDTNILNEVLNELNIIKLSLNKKQFNDNYKKIIERIDYLINTLPNLVEKYTTVFIG